MEILEHSTSEYYDPFASEAQDLECGGTGVHHDSLVEGIVEKEFDPESVFQSIIANYEADKIEHDDAADRFVARAEALMLDAMFVERFDAVQAIAAKMHRMCGEDHSLMNSIASNPFFSKNDSHEDSKDTKDSDSTSCKKHPHTKCSCKSKK